MQYNLIHILGRGWLLNYLLPLLLIIVKYLKYNICCIIAKLSPNFSFSWAEMVFILDLPHPPTHPDKYQNDQVELNLVKQS